MSEEKKAVSKKKNVLLAAGIVIAIVLIACIVILVVNLSAKNSAIGEYQAQQYAFADAGVDPDSAFVNRTQFEFEDGHYVYEIEFTADGIEYDYVVKSSDGTILQKEREQIAGYQPNSTVPQTTGSESVSQETTTPQTTTPGATDSSTTPSYIGEESARSIALEHAGLNEADVTFRSTKLDNDDGTMVYEIEFYQDRVEYDYTIDALTGAVLSQEIDR